MNKLDEKNKAILLIVSYMTSLAIAAIIAMAFIGREAHAEKNISVLSCGDFFIATDSRIQLDILPTDRQCIQFQTNVMDDFPSGMQTLPKNCADDPWLCDAFHYIRQQPPVKPYERCGNWSVDRNHPVKCTWDHSK